MLFAFLVPIYMAVCLFVSLALHVCTFSRCAESQCVEPLKASDCILVTCGSCQLTEDSERWLRRYGAVKKPLTKQALWRYARDQRRDVNFEASPDLPLRPCQEACLNACAKGARVVELACGTGKTRIIRELANNASECDRVTELGNDSCLLYSAVGLLINAGFGIL